MFRRAFLVASLPALFVAPLGSAPVISTPPASVSATSGSPATFAVAATGDGTVAYQWRKFGVPLTGATGANLTLSPVRMADAGFYDVVVSDGSGATTSSAARLFVEPPAYPTTLRIDPTFAPVFESKGGRVWALAGASGGEWIAGGDFSMIGGQPRTYLAKLDGDLAVVPGFAPVLDGPVSAVAVQSDGKIVVGGSFRTVNGRACANLVRLEADGSLDAAFGIGEGLDGAVYALAIQSDGRIVVGGGFRRFAGTERPFLLRLLANGGLDSAFAATAGPNDTVGELVLQPDGKLLLSGNFTAVGGIARAQLARIQTDGTPDLSFDPGVGPNTRYGSLRLALLGEGKVVVGGGFTSFGGAPAEGIVRLLATGAIDASFAVGKIFDWGVYDLAALPDGRIVAKGSSFTTSGGTREEIAMLLPSGARDLTFAPSALPGYSVAGAVVLRADGGIVVGGSFNTVGGQPSSGVVAYSGTGALLARAADGFRAFTFPRRIVPAPGGKWLVAGEMTHLNGTPCPNLARLLPDGTLDADFAPQFAQPPREVAVDGAGRIIAAGDFYAVNGVSRRCIVRLLSDGSVDPSFVPLGGFEYSLYSVALDPAGRIVVFGNFWSYGGAQLGSIARLNPNGTRDPTFNPGSGFGAMAGKAVLQPDGRIVAGGLFREYAGQPRRGVARLNADSSLDATLAAPAAWVDGAAEDVAISIDGSVWAGGGFTLSPGTPPRQLLRFRSDGSLDSAFAAGLDFGYRVRRMLPQTDGKVVVAGFFNSATTLSSKGLLRVGADGAIDPTFRHWDLSVVSAGCDTTWTDDGRLLIAGAWGGRGGASYTGLVMLKPEAPPTPAVSFEPQSQTIALGATATLDVVATGDGPLHYQWYRGERGDVSAPVAGATTAAFTTVPLDAWARYWVRVTNDYGSADSATALVRVVGGTMTFADWVAQDDLLVAQREPLAIPAGDGVTNLMKFALGVSPRDSAAAGLPKATVVTEVGKPDALALEFAFNPLAQHIRVALEVSADLAGWSEVPSVLEVVATNSDGTQLVRLREAAPPAATRRFGRLVVDLTP